MLYIIIGFIFGFFIPHTVRRYFKIKLNENIYFAADLYWIFKITKHVSKQKRATNKKYLHLQNRYFMRSLGWGITTSAILFLIYSTTSSFEAPWIAFFVVILLLLSEIDKYTELLPDVFTYPLLLTGFLYAAFSGNLLADTTADAAQNSALGAFFGFFIPFLASLLTVKKYPNGICGGDIKILAAIGAWLGLVNIPYIILLACIIFAASCFINKKKAGAFGPSIVLAALIILSLMIY